MLTDWQIVHAFSSHLCLVLTALHVALHWKWVATNLGKHLFRLPTPERKVQPESEATS